MSTLVPCPGCHRHVKSDERICPFCRAAMTPVAPEACSGRCARPFPSRLASAALVAAGAALLGAACENSHSTIVPYGISPPFDAGTRVDSGSGQPDAAPDAKK
jgi:hypothetical protein